MQIKKVVLAFCFSLLALSLFAQDFPEKPSTLVNDYTKTLSPEQVSSLEQKLVAFDDSTSIQITVVVIKSLGGYDISEYAARLGEKWGVGRDKKNNGLVLLVAIEDHKVTIQTGYGLEGAVPDAIARRIIEKEIKPGFKAGDYYGGLDKGTDAIISYTKGEYKNDDPKPKQSKGIPVGLIIFIVIIMVAFISKGGGGRGGNVIGRSGSSPLWWLLAGNMLGNSGRSSGDGWGGFSGGGGSSGGGGFGGFGGGSFGGGGASGSW